MVIYDPLDRDIPAEGENQATKRVELIEMIDKLNFIETDDLDIPLSNQMSMMLSRMFSKGMKSCNDILESYIKEAEAKGMGFEKNFNKEPLI